MKKQIHVRVSPTGEITVEAHGLKGQGCEAATKAIGRLSIVRATDIRFNDTTQQWEVRQAGGEDAPLFSHPSRQQCVRWELENLEPETTSQPVWQSKCPRPYETALYGTIRRDAKQVAAPGFGRRGLGGTRG
jgi:hypothetical protein